MQHSSSIAIWLHTGTSNQSNMKKYKHSIVMILLVIVALIAGYGFICFMVEHIFLSLLMVFCISCALAVEREV